LRLPNERRLLAIATPPACQWRAQRLLVHLPQDRCLARLGDHEHPLGRCDMGAAGGGVVRRTGRFSLL